MPPTQSQLIADAISTLRERRGMTQTQVAAAAGIPQSTYARVEITGRARAGTFVAIASALHVPIGDLLEAAETPAAVQP